MPLPASRRHRRTLPPLSRLGARTAALGRRRTPTRTRDSIVAVLSSKGTITVKTKSLLAVVSAGALLVTLAGCSPDVSAGGSTDSAGGDAGSCSNTIVNKDAPQVSVWAWYPNMPHGRGQVQQVARRRAGLLDERRPGRRRIRQVLDRDRGRRRAPPTWSCSRPRSSRVHHPGCARRPQRARRRRREGQLQRRCMEGRLQRRLRLRHPGRRRPDGHDLPRRHLREVRHRRADDVGRIRRCGAAGQRRGRPVHGRLRQQRARLVHGSDDAERRRRPGTTSRPTRRRSASS